MNSKTVKNLTTLFAFLMLAVVFTSCNRGGAGCPYELQAATDVLSNILK